MPKRPPIAANMAPITIMIEGSEKGIVRDILAINSKCKLNDWYFVGNN